MDGVCDRDVKCYDFLGPYEEDIEEWWQQGTIETPVDPTTMLGWLCISKAKVCCAKGTYGKQCSECPGGKDRPCSGHGTCAGDGQRTGSGKCTCNAGWTGAVCDTCSDGYFLMGSGATADFTCQACDTACTTCIGPGPSGCTTCREGYRHDAGSGCTDVDECARDIGSCEAGKFCSNTAGSFLCVKCDRACGTACTGSGARACTDCADGYELTDNGCDDVDECKTGSACESTDYCVNTRGSVVCKRCAPECAGCSGPGSGLCTACAEGYTRDEFNICVAPVPVAPPANEAMPTSEGGSASADTAQPDITRDDL